MLGAPLVGRVWGCVLHQSIEYCAMILATHGGLDGKVSGWALSVELKGGLVFS